MPINDNDSATQGWTAPVPDAHGHAALLLVESLIHGLLERSIIGVDDAIEIVECAKEVQVEIAEAADGHGAPMWRSHALLSSIAESLGHDAEDRPTSLNPVPEADRDPAG